MLARSHYCALAQAYRGYRNALISGEAIRKACPLHTTQGSPDFVGVNMYLKLSISLRLYLYTLVRFYQEEAHT